MFQLDTKMVKVTSLNFRKEKDEKGDEHGVCDIGFSAPMENEVLDHFNPLYRPAFYTGDDQADMVSGARLPHLKFAFPRFSHKGSLEGYTFLAHIGAGGPSEVKLNDSVINKVYFQLQDKGAVGMDFIVRARTHPADVGKLSELLDTEVQISLVPPDEQKRFEIEQAKKNRKRALDEHFKGGAPADEPDTQTGNLIDDDEEDQQSAGDPDFREVDQAQPAGQQGQYQVE
ncbi:hypothetical protein [Herbaspirillum chlorophenolicum]|uniref:hypothetical protein n=1 Tax=Herbaspirillum chlorophenolicum TaxID=211589 RepID=UPI00067CE2A9|nr:hypothetical protein [Herbaspirillum chlorophenolicum]